MKFLIKITPSGLLILNGLEETLEIAHTEAVVVISLDDLNEDSWSVFQRLGEELQEVTLIVVVDQDLEALNGFKVFFDVDGHAWNVLSQVVVVGGRHIEELDTSRSHGFNGLQDVVGF